MIKEINEDMSLSIKNFQLPKYEEIPKVGLYLEQTTKYISDFFESFEGINITSSMVSNYVKKKLVSNPVKKQYRRDQIAYLIFIVVAKTVLSLDDISLFIEIQKTAYKIEDAYGYFCFEFENMLKQVFGLEYSLNTISADHSYEKNMLRNMVIAVANKIYLDKCCQILREEKNKLNRSSEKSYL